MRDSYSLIFLEFLIGVGFLGGFCPFLLHMISVVVKDASEGQEGRSPEDYVRWKVNHPDHTLTNQENDYAAAQLLVTIGEHEKALPFYESAFNKLETLRDNHVWEGMYVRVGNQLANTLDFLGKIKEAEIVYNKMVEASPCGTVLGDYASFLHKKRKEYDLAERYFKQSLLEEPDQSSLHLKYAGFLRYVRKDFDTAEKHYILAVKMGPQNVDALGTYASYLHGLGEADGLRRAEQLYQAAYELDKTHVNNLCNYGLFLSEELCAFERAEGL